MYPEVKSEFPFSTTHEIVGKLQKALDQVLEEIDELARADPVTPHRFEAVFLSIALEPNEDKKHQMRRVAYEVQYSLYVPKRGGGLKRHRRRKVYISNPVGPLNSMEEDSLHPKRSISMEETFSDVSLGVRHLYLSEVRGYRVSEKKRLAK